MRRKKVMSPAGVSSASRSGPTRSTMGETADHGEPAPSVELASMVASGKEAGQRSSKLSRERPVAAVITGNEGGPVLIRSIADLDVGVIDPMARTTSPRLLNQRPSF